MKRVIHLSLSSRKTYTIIEVVQYSTKPDIVFVIDDYLPAVGSECALYIEKPDGTKIYNACELDTNRITYHPTTQSFAVKGKQFGQLKIVEPDGVAISFPMLIDVTKTFIDDSAVESQDEFTLLEQALQTVSSYDGRIQTNTDNIEQLQQDLDTKLSLSGGTLTGDLSINDNIFLTADGSIASLGKDILQGEDLNNYTTPGIYATRLSATASSLSNCPTTYAFRLEVTSVTKSISPSYIVQKVKDYLANEYLRYGTKSGSTWTWSYWRVIVNRVGPTFNWNDTYVTADRGGVCAVRDNILYLTVWFKTSKEIPQDTVVLSVGGLTRNFTRGYFPITGTAQIFGQVYTNNDGNSFTTNAVLPQSTSYRFINAIMPLME